MNYKAPDNSLHFLSDADIANGGEKFLPHGCVQINDLEADALRPKPDPKEAIKSQIVQLEAQITQRRLREAMISGDKSFIQSIDAQIAALRAQL